MRNLTKVLAIVFLNLSIVPLTEAAGPSPLEAYLKAYNDMAKLSAIKTNSLTAESKSRDSYITTMADAQAKLMNARTAFITAVANANATNAKTLETMEQVKSLSMDNNLKRADTFYKKKALSDGYKGLNIKKRPTQEDAIRYSKVSKPNRLAKFELQSVNNRISWPEALQREEFFDHRIRIQGLFAIRGLNLHSGISSETQKVIEDMHAELRSMIRQVSPNDYMASRKFIQSLAHEARFPNRIDGVVSK